MTPRRGASGALVGAMLAAGLGGASACSSAASPGAGGAGSGTSATSGTSGTPASSSATGTASRGSCTYVNPFSKGQECKEYTGAAWSAASAASDCKSNILGAPGMFAPGAACALPQSLGTCAVTKSDGTSYLLVSAGSDASLCQGAKTGCETFAMGSFTPSATCDGTVTPGDGGVTGNVFVQPYQVCKDPLPGEPPGQSAGGKVCTWTLVSACTEAGRHYQDYASCADVLTQRPYYPTPPAGVTAASDPRLADPAYMAEIAWARSQVEASACVCCHSKPLAPQGPGQWFVESPGIWLDSVADSGVALMAGLAASDALGAFPPQENNGFDRTTLGLPTTDVPRMQKLMVGEWKRRGHTLADAASVPPFGGPLVLQQKFQPKACDAGQGVAADGTVSWTGGAARYLYVLDPGSKNPGVPPNMDEPTGTRWLVDVPTKALPFSSGVHYGAITGALVQRLPTAGAPAALAAGKTYYLYVLGDIGVPLTRCLFTAP